MAIIEVPAYVRKELHEDEEVVGSLSTRAAGNYYYATDSRLLVFSKPQDECCGFIQYSAISRISLQEKRPAVRVVQGIFVLIFGVFLGLVEMFFGVFGLMLEGFGGEAGFGALVSLACGLGTIVVATFWARSLCSKQAFYQFEFGDLSFPSWRITRPMRGENRKRADEFIKIVETRVWLEKMGWK